MIAMCNCAQRRKWIKDQLTGAWRLVTRTVGDSNHVMGQQEKQQAARPTSDVRGEAAQPVGTDDVAVRTSGESVQANGTDGTAAQGVDGSDGDTGHRDSSTDSSDTKPGR